MEEEYEAFKITDYDLENEFNPNRNRKRLTKEQQTYGMQTISFVLSGFYGNFK
jgi:Tuftelin interacting protein N terminal